MVKEILYMEQREIEIEKQITELKKLREITGMTKRKFAEYFEIPLRTVEDWEAGRRLMPVYLLRLMSYKIGIEYIDDKK